MPRLHNLKLAARPQPDSVPPLAAIAVLASLYFLLGKFGLLLAVPPGYATIVWPPSGIAVAALLIYGRHLWPGIFFGSFLLNAELSGVFAGSPSLDKILVAVGIATGSTLQAVLARELIDRFLSIPVALKRFADGALLLFLAGPAACLCAASVGTASLYLGGVVEAEGLLRNWRTWWTGDVLGVVIFLPIMLFMPGGARALRWRGENVSALPLASMLVLLLPLGLTFYAWTATSQYIFEKSSARFSALAEENKSALQHRLDSYAQALDGGGGLFAASNLVLREEWVAYVDALDLEKRLPGINGIGYIAEVDADSVDEYAAAVRTSQPTFVVHPETVGRPYYIIEMIEPIAANQQALGLNIGFEDNRLSAAERARDSGEPAVTDRILLVQELTKSPGFLLLRPMYAKGLPVDTVENRRRASRGWIYAPFVADRFMADLTASQGRLLQLRVYDGETEGPESLIYSSAEAAMPEAASQYKVVEHEDIMQQRWTLVWTSTPEFEAQATNREPLLILVGGLLFTALFGALLVFFARRAETVSALVALKTREISASEQQLRLLINNTPVAVAMFDRELRYIMTSERWKIEYELETQDIAGRDILAVTPYVFEGSYWKDKFERAIAGETFQDNESYWTRPDGRREWTKWAIHPWLDASGQVGGIVLFTLSITGRKAEESRTQILKEVATEAVEAPSVEAIFRSVLEKLCGYFCWHVGHAYRWNEETGKLTTTGIWHESEDATSIDAFREVTAATDLAAGTGLPGRAYASGKTECVFDFAAETSFPRSALLPDLNLHTGIGIPVLANGAVIAVLELYSQDKVQLSPDDFEFLDLLCLQLSRIVERRSFEEALARSNRLNNAVLDSAEYMVVATDRDGQVLVFNKAAERKSGYSADEIVGKETPKLWHDADEVVSRARELSEEIGETIAPGFDVFVRKAALHGSDSGEWTFIRKDGGRFPVNLTVTPLMDPLHGVVGFLGILEDITLRKQQDAALRASEEMFRSAMQFASTGMALVSLEGRWLNVNPAFCEMIGYSEAEMGDMDFRAITHPDDHPLSTAALREFNAGTRTQLHAERRYVRKSGRVIWVLVDVSVAYNPDGTKKAYIAQFQDITERHEMERMKSEFVSVVSHELRTPLTSIRGSLGLINGTMSGKLPDAAHRLIDIAHKNCERLILLINDILDMDKIATGHMRFQIEDEDLSEIVTGAIEANRAYADRFGVELKLVGTAEGARVRADATRLAQVLANLLSNAAKFSPENGEVHLAVEPRDGGYRVSVRDFGKGIPAEFQDRIFGRFSQADSSVTRAKGGTGLGLHISKQIMEQMDGRIGFESSADRGTTFWIDIPAAGAEPTVEKENRLAG